MVFHKNQMRAVTKSGFVTTSPGRFQSFTLMESQTRGRHTYTGTPPALHEVRALSLKCVVSYGS